MNFKVLKPFFKASQKMNYSIDDIADFTKEEAEGMLNEGYLEQTKDKATAKVEAVEEVGEVEGFKVSTKATESEIIILPKVKK